MIISTSKHKEDVTSFMNKEQDKKSIAGISFIQNIHLQMVNPSQNSAWVEPAISLI